MPYLRGNLARKKLTISFMQNNLAAPRLPRLAPQTVVAGHTAYGPLLRWATLRQSTMG